MTQETDTQNLQLDSILAQMDDLATQAMTIAINITNSEPDSPRWRNDLRLIRSYITWTRGTIANIRNYTKVPA